MKTYTCISETDFSNMIHLLETEDTNHADNFNLVYIELLKNTVKNFQRIEEKTRELKDILEQIESIKKSVSDGKMNVADAITEMGISTSSTEDSPATFEVLTDHIRAITPTLTLTGNTAKAVVGLNEVTEQIGDSVDGNVVPKTSDTLLIPAGSCVYASSDYIMKSLGGNAEATHVLIGKTFSSNASGREKSGTMPNQGAKTAALNCGETYTIPAGYHNGSGKVKANSLASQITASAVYNKYKHTEKVLATCPVDLTSANCHYNGNDAIYLIGGNNGKQTTRYNIKDNTYTILCSAPQNISWNSSVMLGNQIICFGDSNVLTFVTTSNEWHTGVTIPASSIGGSVVLVDNVTIFGSTNSAYSKYVTSYSHAFDFSGCSFSTIFTNQAVCSNKNTGVRFCNPGVSNGVDVFTQNIKTMLRPDYSSYLNKKTLPGVIYGGSVAIPNRGYFITAVQYSNSNILWDGITDTMTTIYANQHIFWTAALCSVGDDIYIFGSGIESDNKKASVFHTEQFFKTHY